MSDGIEKIFPPFKTTVASIVVEGLIDIVLKLGDHIHETKAGRCMDEAWRCFHICRYIIKGD